MRLFIALLFASICWSQSPEFEVASVKLNNSARAGSDFNRTPGGGLNAINVTLKEMIRFAYDLRDQQLVGASGCIMGIVGAWAGFLMRHRHAAHARQRLANVVMIVAIQIGFDLSTPQVSMSAHLCGLVAGFLLGLVLTPRPKPA